MFPYYFNVSFRYFGFVPVFRFRFGKSRHPYNLLSEAHQEGHKFELWLHTIISNIFIIIPI